MSMAICRPYFSGRVMNIGEASANLCLFLHAQYPLQVKESVSKNGINISNSNIGILNTGEIKDIHSISVNIKSGAHEVAEAIKQITEAVSKSPDLTGTTRSMVLEQLEELSKQALIPIENQVKAWNYKGNYFYAFNNTWCSRWLG